MDDILYCVFLKESSIAKISRYVNGPELIGIFDDKQSAETIMELVDVAFGDYKSSSKDQDDAMNCYCKEFSRNKVRREYLGLLNNLYEKES